MCLHYYSQVARSPAGERKKKGSLSAMPHVDQRRLDHRLERFDLGMRSPRSSLQAKSVENDLAFQSKPMVDENGVVDWDAITIKGTSTKLEKDYLRLTQVRATLYSAFPLRCVFYCVVGSVKKRTSSRGGVRVHP